MFGEMIDKDIIRETIEIFGIKNQTIVCAEELAELIQAITKIMRKDGSESIARYNLLEEMADTVICIEQLKEIYEIQEDDLKEMIAFKQERQVERNNDAKIKGARL